MAAITALSSISDLNKQVALFEVSVYKMWKEWDMPTTANILCAVAFFSILDEIPTQLKDGLSEKDHLHLKKLLRVYLKEGQYEVERLIQACDTRSTQIGKRARTVRKQVHALISTLTFDQYCDLLIHAGKIRDEDGLTFIVTVVKATPCI